MPARGFLLKIVLAVVFLALVGALVLIWSKTDTHQTPNTSQKSPHIQQVERKNLGTILPAK